MTSKNLFRLALAAGIMVSALALTGCAPKEDQAEVSPTAGLTPTVPPPVDNPKTKLIQKATANSDKGGSATPGG